MPQADNTTAETVSTSLPDNLQELNRLIAAAQAKAKNLEPNAIMEAEKAAKAVLEGYGLDAAQFRLVRVSQPEPEYTARSTKRAGKTQADDEGGTARKARKNIPNYYIADLSKSASQGYYTIRSYQSLPKELKEYMASKGYEPGNKGRAEFLESEFARKLTEDERKELG